ncbi:MAG: hypothetical protein CFH01_01774 [Alphaproteobacteria bacterium MarineAlpha2_Bin1]|nr:MAG: hypothetical protein CFH01_01774 [Alphaproteobacteria bacterium MarineAlpha2_Bin1]
MSRKFSREIRSEVTKDGKIIISIAKVPVIFPKKDEVLVKIEASPINPSDLGRLITFGADLNNINILGSGDETVTTIEINNKLLNSLKNRIGKSMNVGNEGAGIIVESGKDSKRLLGKIVGLAGGGMYSEYRCVKAKSCLVMSDGTSAREAASSFVNPLTALGFIETMKLENHKAIVHTAAASNLGKMLVKLCKNESIPLINIVRSAKQVENLKKIGAEFVLNMNDNLFMEDLINAIKETGATLGFDATGGGNDGKLVGQILSSMEIAASTKSKEYLMYGSESFKQIYIYGVLDRNPIVLKNSFGFYWGIGGWLLMPMIKKFGLVAFQNMREKVAREIKTTFRSEYKKIISFEEMLQPEIIRDFSRQSTGEKYLLDPWKQGK